MANIRSEEATAELHRKILTAATALFMQKGFERTTFVDIAKLSDVPKSKILYEFASKEEILSLLVTKFLDGVAEASDAVSKKLTDDKLNTEYTAAGYYRNAEGTYNFSTEIKSSSYNAMP